MGAVPTAATATDQMLWFQDRVLPVLIGSLIALVGAFLIQLWLVPRVEVRRRRLQRWEDDVRSLGELLVFRQPEAVSQTRAAINVLALLANLPSDSDDEPGAADKKRLETAIWKQQKDADAACRDLDAINAQINWLLGRVESRLGGAARPDFSVLVRRYQLAARSPMLLAFRAGDGTATEAEVDAWGAESRSATNALVDAIKALDAVGPRRRPGWARFASLRRDSM